MHGFVLPVPSPHKSTPSPSKKAWGAAQLQGPLHTLWRIWWWGCSAGEFQPLYPPAPGTAHFGACIELQTLTGSRDKDMNKVLHGSLLRAHDDPGFQAGQVPELGRAGPATAGPSRLSSKGAQSAGVLQGSVTACITNKK